MVRFIYLISFKIGDVVSFYFAYFNLRAFAIWGPIFLGELIYVSSQLFVSKDQKVVSILREMGECFNISMSDIFPWKFVSQLKISFCKSCTISASSIVSIPLVCLI